MDFEEIRELSVHDVVVAVLNTVKPMDVGVIDDEDDIFTKFELNSLEIFSALAKLERTLNVVIGESPSEFDRIRTFAGLQCLLSEKMQADMPAEKGDQ